MPLWIITAISSRLVVRKKEVSWSLCEHFRRDLTRQRQASMDVMNENKMQKNKPA